MTLSLTHRCVRFTSINTQLVTKFMFICTTNFLFNAPPWLLRSIHQGYTLFKMQTFTLRLESYSVCNLHYCAILSAQRCTILLSILNVHVNYDVRFKFWCLLDIICNFSLCMHIPSILYIVVSQFTVILEPYTCVSCFSSFC